MNSIDRFVGEYRFLSNFYPCDVRWRGRQYPSVEHAYQAAKTKDPVERMRIAAAPTPGLAKALGRQVRLVEDWDRVKIRTMRKLLQRKFADPVLMRKLISTRPHTLVEGNYWRDTFWGVCQGSGMNWLGRLLMEIRDGK